MTADLNYAINNLPETAPRGRMTKGIAMTILLKYRMIQGKFVEAEQLCRDIIALGVYGLQADYTAIFDINNHGNNEIILCVPCNSSSSWTANYMIAEVLPADMPWADNAAGWGGYVMSWDFYNTFNYADKRLACIHTEYVSTTGKYMDKSNSQQLKYGALPLKYGVDPNMSGAQVGNDLVIYRYSDILLSLAECIARNSGVNDEAEGYLNQVRRRAGLGDIMGYNTDDFLMAILTERGHEFFLEGLRRQDLIRFGKYAEYANNRIAAANAAGSPYNDRRRSCENVAKAIQALHPDRQIDTLRDCTWDDLEAVKATCSAEDIQRATFVLGEKDRVLAVCDALLQGDYEEVGRQMYLTHQGLSRDYEVSCEELDFLNDLARECGVTGSRIMGGGFGGCTINLVKDELYETFTNRVVEAFEHKYDTNLSSSLLLSVMVAAK